MRQMHEMTMEEQYLLEARRTQDMLERAFVDFPHLHHDVGFMWRISSGFDYDLTGDRKIGIEPFSLQICWRLAIIPTALFGHGMTIRLAGLL